MGGGIPGALVAAQEALTRRAQARLRGGSKNGRAATVTATVLRWWSSVVSMDSPVPGAAGSNVCRLNSKNKSAR